MLSFYFWGLLWHLLGVQRLLEQIEADAKARLTLPSNRSPHAELARFKTFLKRQSHRLKLRHRAGAPGRETCLARSVLMDVLMRYLLQGALAHLPSKVTTLPPPLALVAIGGYGRQELNPHSDIDIMFLHEGEVSPYGKHRGCMSALTEEILLCLFDLGMKVGHSVRNPEDCVKEANQNMQSKTSLIEARLITGNAALFERMEALVTARCVMGFEQEYIAARLEDQSARRAKYGDSACMQEPNIKNGCGGLRDYQNLLWMAWFKYRIRTLEELQEREWISGEERFQLQEAYNFLLRVRNDLHYQVNRPMDILLKGVQPTIALNLGYEDRSPIQRLEKFMRQLYTHMRNVYLITRTVEERLAFQQKPKPRTSWRQLLFGRREKAPAPQVDGFYFLDGEIVPASKLVFREHPRRLMRVFLLAQQRGLRLHPDLVQMVRHHLALVDKAFWRDAHVHETFLEILSQRGGVAPVLRTMHEVGLLGRYLPEFGKLTCLVQHEFFHRYTADEHTLVCVEMLDAVWNSPKLPFSRYREIFQKVERPFVLYLALLLHDAGKSEPSRHHADRSAMLALRVARRLGLDAAATQTLRLLVEQHLAMIQVSQKRDLEDPSVARKFALQFKSAENLHQLLLHTLTDTLGTRADLWNDYKEALILTLYEEACRFLHDQADGVKAGEKQRDQHIQALRRLVSKEADAEEVEAHFNLMPPRYFQTATAEEVQADLQMAHQFMQFQLLLEDRALEPVVSWVNLPDRVYAKVRICTWDRSGLFSKIAGSLTAARLNILGARIFSRADGIIFDAFTVIDAATGALPGREARDKFEQVFKACLTGQADLDALLAALKKSRPLYQYLEGERIATTLNFDNSSSETDTIIEIETEDRIGLLYTVSHILSHLGLDISTAKISTEKGAAIDTFMVRDTEGRKITSPERLHALESALRSAVASLEPA